MTPKPEQHPEQHNVEPDQDPVRPVEYNLGWRVVAASIILPLGLLVTESLPLTLVILGLSAMILARANPELNELFEHDPLFYWAERMTHIVVLGIFVASLVRNLMR